MKLTRILAVFAAIAATLALGGVTFLVLNTPRATDPVHAAVVSPTPTVTAAVPTATAAPYVPCYAPDIGIYEPVTGCTNEVGDIYTPPVPDTVGVDWTCYAYAVSTRSYVDAAEIEMSSGEWVAAANDFESASVGFGSMYDELAYDFNGTIRIANAAGRASQWYSYGAEGIREGYHKQPLQYLRVADANVRRTIQLAQAAGTSCTIPVLAGT